MGAAALMTCTSRMPIGDETVKCDGVNLRPMGDSAPYVSGFDASEIYGRSKCPKEAILGAQPVMQVRA